MNEPNGIGTDDGFDPKTIADNGLSTNSETGGNELGPVERELGFILDTDDEEKVVKHIHQMREEQEPSMNRNRAVWKRNRWWREGKRFVRLEKKENFSEWTAKLPVGMGAAPPVPNKTDRLCRRITNTILVDKPWPDCDPGDNSGEARDAAEFATRYLSVKGSEAELNMNQLLRLASGKAQTFASAFGWVTMDPAGGGHQPRRMLAHPEAPHKEVGLLDPNTGVPADESSLKMRYIRPDGALSDDSSDADYQWLPSPRVRLLTGLQVQMLPENARSMRDAIGCMITDTTTLGELKAQFKDVVKALSKDELQDLCSWRPKKMEDLLPPYTKEPEEQKDEDGNYRDSQMVVVITVYYRCSAEYPMGCYAVVGGKTLVLHKQKWTAMFDQPERGDGTEAEQKEECLQVPVIQCRCLDDDTFDNPYGIGIVEHLGPADEIRASSLGSQLEYMFRAANPIPFLPMGSIVQPKQFMLRDGNPVWVNPQGTPFYEPIPPLSPEIPKMREEMSDEMDDESGLQQAAQGVEDPNVRSGIHAQAIIQEALKAVVNMKDNLGDFYVGLNRIILEQSRAYCTVPQMISYVGEDGEYKEHEWSRTDFRTTRVVTIAKGSFTMHTLIAKQEMADQAFDRKVIDAETYQDLVSGGVSPVLGIEDNPHLLRVRRQLELYTKGPTPEWVQANLVYQQQLAVFQAEAAQAAQIQAEQAAMAPPTDPAAQGAPAPGAPAPAAPPPQPPPSPFTDRIPVDLEPAPAKVRHRQISTAMASSKFQKFDPGWQQVLLAEYAEMKNAAGVMTVPEVQKAQADAAAQAAQAALAPKVQIKMSEDAGSVAGAEEAAIQGIKKGEAGDTSDVPATAAQAPAPPPQPVQHFHITPPRNEDITYERDASGRVTGHKIRPAGHAA